MVYETQVAEATRHITNRLNHSKNNNALFVMANSIKWMQTKEAQLVAQAKQWFILTFKNA